MSEKQIILLANYIKKHVLEENKVNTAQKLSESLHKTEPTPDGVDATGYVWHQNTKI